MNQVPLNLIKPLVNSYMLLINQSKDRSIQFNAFCTSCGVWGDFYEKIMAFGTDDDVPITDMSHDVQFYCMLMLTATKLEMSKDYLVSIGIGLVREMQKESGMAIDDFCLLFDADVAYALRQFLQISLLNQADESKEQ